MFVLHAHKDKKLKIKEDASYQRSPVVQDNEELVQLSVLTALFIHTCLLIRDNVSSVHQARLLHQWESVLHAQKVLGLETKENVNLNH